MFHVKHYSLIAKFYSKNDSSLLEDISIESLIDLIYSDNNNIGMDARIVVVSFDSI